MNVQGKVIIVAGGSGGIGRVTCRLLASHGATVIGASRKDGQLQGLLQELREFSPESSWVEADLQSRETWEDLVRSVYQKFHRIDVLVNCVGVLIPGSLIDLNATEIERVVTTNLLTIVYGAKSVLPIMKREGKGHIINLGSLGGIIPMPFEALYSATKFAVRGFSLSLSEELKGTGINVSSPGAVRTSMLNDEAKDDRSTIAFATKSIEPGEVARAILAVIEKPKREVILPKGATKIGLLMSFFPRLFGICYPLLDSLGRIRLRQYRKYSLSETPLQGTER